MVPYLELMMPRRRFVAVMDHRGLPLSSDGNAWLLAEGEPLDPDAITFVRERGHLWNIGRRRYFETVLAPLSRRAEFAEGWYAAAAWQRYQWRWMGKRSLTRLPAVEGEAALRLRGEVAGELLPVRVVIRLDGKTVADESLTAAKFEREYRTHGGRMLEISVDKALQPGPHDPRELGLRLEALSWGPL